MQPMSIFMQIKYLLGDFTTKAHPTSLRVFKFEGH